jgi:hypothetical protein
MNMLAVAVAAAATTLLIPQIDFVSSWTAPATVSGSHVRSTDVIIGDGDFNQVRPEYPTDPVTEHANHTLRLQYIESMLRNRDVSDMPAELRAERMRNLDRLRDYWTRGEYPVNYENPTAWEPCFIDAKGAICAVGYLVEQSAGREVAEKINSQYQYATIKEIDAPVLEQWIARSGLTKAEVVTIQGPSLGPNAEPFGQERIVRRGKRRGVDPALKNAAQNNALLNNASSNNVSLNNAALDNMPPTQQHTNALPVELVNTQPQVEEPSQIPTAEEQIVPDVQPTPVQAPAVTSQPTVGASID